MLFKVSFQPLALASTNGTVTAATITAKQLRGRIEQSAIYSEALTVSETRDVLDLLQFLGGDVYSSFYDSSETFEGVRKIGGISISFRLTDLAKRKLISESFLRRATVPEKESYLSDFLKLLAALDKKERPSIPQQ